MSTLIVLLALAFADTSPGTAPSVDPARYRLDRVLSGEDEFVFAAAASPDGRWLAAGRRDGRIAVWNLPTGERELFFRAKLGRWN